MTIQEAEKLIDDLDKAFKAGLLKATLITVICAMLLFFLLPWKYFNPSRYSCFLLMFP